mgnify:CR=1 FL=1
MNRHAISTPVTVLWVTVAMVLVNALGIVAPATAQSASTGDIRVHVLPVVNRSGESQFDAVGSTVTGTVALTLRLLNGYTISEGQPQGFADRLPLPEDPVARRRVLGTMAEALNVENIVFGEVLPPPAGDATALPRIRLGVFDRLAGEITVQEERAPDSLFDVFGVTDQLAADVLSGFSGRRVAFGSIRIQPSATGQPPEYRVELDGQIVGTDLRSIESILTGEHRLTVTIDVLGEDRVVFDGPVTVDENRTATVDIPFPDIDMEREAQRVAIARREAALADALARLGAERDRLRELADDSGTTDAGERASVQTQRGDPRAPAGSPLTVPVARELFPRSGEYIDPAAVREAALENARLAAAVHAATGRGLLAERGLTAGASAFGEISELATTFGQPDSFGYADQVAFATAGAGDVEIQRDRSPQAVLPWILLGAATALTIPTAQSYYNEPGPPQAQYVPFMPVLFAGVGTAVWNATDWDHRRLGRTLRRFGRDGYDAVATDRPLRRWELAAGVASSLGFSGYRITPGDAGSAYGVGAVEFADVGRSAVSVRARYWRSPHTALGGELRVAALGGWRHVVTLSDNYSYTIDDPAYSGDYSELDVNQLFLASAGGTYTRTGRTLLEAGLTLRLLDFSIGNIRYQDDVLQEQTYEELLGGATAFVPVPGIQTSLGFRFGRGALPPWELSIGYRLDRLAFPNGILSDEGPFYLHRIDVAFRRSVFLGDDVPPPTDAPWPGAGRTSKTLDEGRAAARDRWQPLPVRIYADPGGFFTRGPRLGLEYAVNPQWSVGLHGRWAASLAMAEVLPVDSLRRSEFAWPGVSLRWYQQPQPRAPGADRRGWYAGGIVEYASFDRPNGHGIGADPGEYTTNSGSLWFLLAEGGYRIPAGRSGFIDLGVQAGFRFGEGYRSERFLVLSDGSQEFQTGTSINGGTWLYPTLAFGTRLY